MVTCRAEFTSSEWHAFCPACRKRVQREKERLNDIRREMKLEAAFSREEPIVLDWWLPQ
jgi:hypothetical protein